MKVTWSPEAVDDFEAAVDYLLEHNPDAASGFAARLLSVIDTPVDGRFDGPRRRLSSGETVRTWGMRPYRIYYRRDSEALSILHIHQQRAAPIAEEL